MGESAVKPKKGAALLLPVSWTSPSSPLSSVSMGVAAAALLLPGCCCFYLVLLLVVGMGHGGDRNFPGGGYILYVATRWSTLDGWLASRAADRN